MKFAYSRADLPSEDLASGRVLFSRPGLTAFPVRLASELFLRAASVLASGGRPSPYHFYDPTCGGGYLATVLGFLHGDQLQNISMSDISTEAVSVAVKNAALLTSEGLSWRLSDLSNLVVLHNRQSHRAALQSGNKLFALLRHLPTNVFNRSRKYPPFFRRSWLDSSKTGRDEAFSEALSAHFVAIRLVRRILDAIMPSPAALEFSPDYRRWLSG